MVFYFFHETKIILVWFGEQSGSFIIDSKNFQVSPSWKWEIPIGNYLHTESLRYLSLLKLIWDLFSKLIIDSQSLSFNRRINGVDHFKRNFRRNTLNMINSSSFRNFPRNVLLIPAFVLIFDGNTLYIDFDKKIFLRNSYKDLISNLQRFLTGVGF